MNYAVPHYLVKPVFNAAVIFHLTYIKTPSAILLWLGTGDTELSSWSRINQQSSLPVRSVKPIGTFVETHRWATVYIGKVVLLSACKRFPATGPPGKLILLNQALPNSDFASVAVVHSGIIIMQSSKSLAVLLLRYDQTLDASCPFRRNRSLIFLAAAPLWQLCPRNRATPHKSR